MTELGFKPSCQDSNLCSSVSIMNIKEESVSTVSKKNKILLSQLLPELGWQAEYQAALMCPTEGDH